jgi:hypothetical protein
MAIIAAQAFEACRTENDDSYDNCTVASLQSIEPVLNQVGSRLTVTSAARSFEVQVAANRDAGAAVFTLSRASNGGTSRTCSTGTAERGGCSAQSSGTW